MRRSVSALIFCFLILISCSKPARGLAARPCNEAIEMIDHERVLGRAPSRQSQVSSIIGGPTWQPTFLFLMGYPTQQAHACPRRSVALNQIS